jgi:hypothetical protein
MTPNEKHRDVFAPFIEADTAHLRFLTTEFGLKVLPPLIAAPGATVMYRASGLEVAAQYEYGSRPRIGVSLKDEKHGRRETSLSSLLGRKYKRSKAVSQGAVDFKDVQRPPCVMSSWERRVAERYLLRRMRVADQRTIEGLAALGSLKALPLLRNALSNSNKLIQIASAESMWALVHSSEAQDVLLRLARDEKWVCTSSGEETFISARWPRAHAPS